MALTKYGDNEQAEVFVGPEAEVVNRHLQRVAKPVSEFSQDEKKALQNDLEVLRAEQKVSEQEAVREQALEAVPEPKPSVPTAEPKSKGAKSHPEVDESE